MSSRVRVISTCHSRWRRKRSWEEKSNHFQVPKSTVLSVWCCSCFISLPLLLLRVCCSQFLRIWSILYRLETLYTCATAHIRRHIPSSLLAKTTTELCAVCVCVSRRSDVFFARRALSSSGCLEGKFSSSGGHLVLAPFWEKKGKARLLSPSPLLGLKSKECSTFTVRSTHLVLFYFAFFSSISKF